MKKFKSTDSDTYANTVMLADLQKQLAAKDKEIDMLKHQLLVNEIEPDNMDNDSDDWDICDAINTESAEDTKPKNLKDLILGVFKDIRFFVKINTAWCAQFLIFVLFFILVLFWFLSIVLPYSVATTSDVQDMSIESYVAENVTEDVTGDVTCDVTGDVTGDVTEDVTGDVTGNVTEDVTGDVTEDATFKYDLLRLIVCGLVVGFGVLFLSLVYISY